MVISNVSPVTEHDSATKGCVLFIVMFWYYFTTQISRESIDAVKKYWKKDMSKDDWKLIIELKKTFEIMWVLMTWAMYSTH